MLRRLSALPLLCRCLSICSVDLWHLPIRPASSFPPASSLFLVRWAEPSDREQLGNYFGDRYRVERRLARGDRCALALCQESIGAAAWVSLGPGHFNEDWNELRCSFRFPAGVAWSYDGKGTRMGAWGTLMKQLPELLRREGATEIATVTDCNNWSSIDAHRSLGYTSGGLLLHARLAGISLHGFKAPRRRWRRLPLTVAHLEIGNTLVD
jgi:hypothetical protein